MYLLSYLIHLNSSGWPNIV